MMLISIALATAAPADLTMLCAGLAGPWRSETDLTLEHGKGWTGSGGDPNWRVEPSGPGKCVFHFGDTPQFALDTTAGFYDTTFYQDGKPTGGPQRGRVIHGELVEPRAWNIVVEAPGKAGPYRMQMTMAGDLFILYMTEQGADATKLKPHAIAVHRRAAP